MDGNIERPLADCESRERAGRDDADAVHRGNGTSSSRSATLFVNDARVTLTQAAGSSQQPPPSSLTFNGSVSGLAGVCPVIIFNVGGRQVVTDANTRFTGGNCSSVRNGRSVEIEAEPISGNVVRATRVRL